MNARLRRRPWVIQTVALYDYDPEELDELPLAEGQQIRVLQVQEDGWWLGYAADDPERVGLFPSNYVRQEYESQQRPQQQQNKVPEAQRQQRQGVRQHEEEEEDDDAGADDGDDGGDEQQEQDQYGGEEQGYDGEVQQHQRQTRQRIQHQGRYQQHKETSGSRRSRVDDETGESEDEEEDAVVPAAPAQPHMVSVLQLKRSLTDAERASEAARAARLKAERERAQQQRRRPPVRTAHNEKVDAGDDDQNDDDDDEGFGRVGRTQGQQQQQLRRRIPLEVEDDEDDDDDDDAAFQYNKGNQRRPDQEKDDGEQEDEQEDEQVVVDDDADDDSNGDGSFSLPSVQESRVKGAISAYQAQQDVGQEEEEEEEAAASRIARKYRDHKIRQQTQQYTSKQSQLRHQRSFAERENAAALAIQRWMLRASSQQRTRNQVLESKQQKEDSERVAQEAELKQKAKVRAAAAARIQTWMRHLLAYFRWKEHVEKERVAMLKRKRVRMLQLEQEARRKAEQEQLRRQQEGEEEEERERERLRLRLDQQELERQQRMQLEQEQRQAEQQQQQQQQQTASTHQREGDCRKEDKTPKKIMKKEAMDLVKILVKKQLDEKLREHDEKMGELQRLVTTLQDVIRKQNEMLIQDSNDRLMVEQQGAHKSIKPPMQTLGNQQQQHHYIPSSMRQPMQASVSSSSLASESHLPSAAEAAAVKEPSIPKPSSHPPMLPQIGGNAAAKASKPSAIKPPRFNDVPSRLPVLSNANARQSSNTPVKQ